MNIDDLNALYSGPRASSLAKALQELETSTASGQLRMLTDCSVLDGIRGEVERMRDTCAPSILDQLRDQAQRIQEMRNLSAVGFASDDVRNQIMEENRLRESLLGNSFPALSPTFCPLPNYVTMAFSEVIRRRHQRRRRICRRMTRNVPLCGRSRRRNPGVPLDVALKRHAERAGLGGRHERQEDTLRLLPAGPVWGLRSALVRVSRPRLSR